MPQPAAAKPIFSSADFKLLRTAVLHYIKSAPEGAESQKYTHLYHRLGRLG